jgi:hypothetical protein
MRRFAAASMAGDDLAAVGSCSPALATGLACGIVAARYPDVIEPPYAAILGTLVVYPVMVTIWWHLNPPGGRGR